MKALIIDEPWMSLLLSGKKTWEMRSRHTSIRGRIALIRKGSGRVVGVADVVGSIGPFDAIAWRAHQSRHRIPLDRQEATANWNVAWVLERARPLVRAIPYEHPNGAVTWVNLSNEVARQLQVDHGANGPQSSLPAPTAIQRSLVQEQMSQETDLVLSDLVPIAKDGSWFSPQLRRSTGFTIGAKGEEIVIDTYASALKELREMAVPRWRRPNSNGNWGIVSGVQWKRVDEVA